MGIEDTCITIHLVLVSRLFKNDMLKKFQLALRLPQNLHTKKPLVQQLCISPICPILCPSVCSSPLPLVPDLFRKVLHFISFPAVVLSVMVQVNMQAMKTNCDRELALKEELVEEQRRSLQKQLRELEADLEDERRNRTAAAGAKKKLEVELRDMECAKTELETSKEEFVKHLRKLQVCEGGCFSSCIS